MTAVAAIIALFWLLSACAMLEADSCADVANRTTAENQANGCHDGFFSAKRQRTAIYRGDDTPRLWTGEPARRRPNIDTSEVNRPPGARPAAAFAGYVGTMRVDYAPDEKQFVTDVADLRAAGATKFDPDEKISIKFDKAPIEFFLKQMLGGALGVNYIAPNDPTGTVTFRSEEPVPKGQLLQVVRDILARNGLEMAFVNGVYHIGRPELLQSLEQTAAAGRAGEQVTRVVRVRKGSTTELAAFVKRLVADDVTLLPTGGGDSIVVRAAPADVDRVSDLITSLSASGIAEDRVAIIPLRQSAPEKIASELSDFYRSRVGSPAEAITVVPLENQQAILVGTKDRRIMEGVKQLVAALDRDWKDEISLRIIPLTHLAADEVVQQLAAIFNGAGAAAAAAGASRYGSPEGTTAGQSARATTRPAAPTMLPTVRPPQPVGSDGEEDGTNLAPPAFNLGSGGLGNGALGNGARAGTPARGDALPPPSAAAGGTPAVKIVADTRNNAVMIYSTFALFKRVREVLRSLDVPQAQVVIEATVAEVNLTDDLEKGVQWYLQSSNLTARSSSDPKPVDGARSGAFIHGSIPLGNVQVDVVINALQEITTVKVISSPYLTVVDGKTARLVIGDQIPFSTRTQNATLSTGATTVTEEVTVKDTGIILEVTPRIRADNSVVLNVNQSVSKPQDSAQHGNLTPVISTREVKSDIVVQSGRTILLAGLIQDRLDKTENGIPVARNLPVVGHLFKQTTDKGTRVELIVMITPRVIRSASQIENIARLLRAQQQIR